MQLQTWRAAAIGAVFAAVPGAALACACGCGVFDVGDGAFMPGGGGLSVWVRDAFMDQDRNWVGAASAPAADNSDKRLQTNFVFAGLQYMVNPSWTVMAELPIYDRSLTTTDDGTVFGPAGRTYTGHITSLGDLELVAMFTGLAADKSTGVGVGVKAPTGDWTGPKGPLGGAEFDRDSLPGTGSTDLIVSGYHTGALGRRQSLSWFAQAKYQVAVATQGGYRPGNELDAAAGVGHDFGPVGPLGKVAPILQLIDSWRARDSGANADPLNSGYQRLLIAPGVEVRVRNMRLYADVAVPIYQHVNAAPSPAVEGTAGQLVAGALFKLQATYDF